MEIVRIRYKSGILQGKEEKEDIFIKTKIGYIRIKVFDDIILEEFKNIIFEKQIHFDSKGKIIK
jgi:hypothetical protein